MFNKALAWLLHKEPTVAQPKPQQSQQLKSEKIMQQPVVYTEEQLMARLRFFIGICLALTLTGIVFVVLYSLIFVTQPLNAISPMDSKFFELIIPIATFLTGTLSGIMLSKPSDQPTPPKPALPSLSVDVPKPAPVIPTVPKVGVPPIIKPPVVE